MRHLLFLSIWGESCTTRLLTQVFSALVEKRHQVVWVDLADDEVGHIVKNTLAAEITTPSTIHVISPGDERELSELIGLLTGQSGFDWVMVGPLNSVSPDAAAALARQLVAKCRTGDPGPVVLGFQTVDHPKEYGRRTYEYVFRYDADALFVARDVEAKVELVRLPGGLHGPEESLRVDVCDLLTFQVCH